MTPAGVLRRWRHARLRSTPAGVENPGRARWGRPEHSCPYLEIQPLGAVGQGPRWAPAASACPHCGASTCGSKGNAGSGWMLNRRARGVAMADFSARNYIVSLLI